jgi:hypothetical protein
MKMKKIGTSYWFVGCVARPLKEKAVVSEKKKEASAIPKIVECGFIAQPATVTFFKQILRHI